MTDEGRGYVQELDRIRRVSDMLCTAHAGMRDKFSRKALALDLCVLGLSTWLVALAFVQPTIATSLSPFGMDEKVWMGLLATGTFFLTLVQLKVDWKGRADAHARTLDLYAEVKRETGYLLASGDLDPQNCRRVLARYDIASAVGIEIPERAFLAQKRRHRVKVAVSKYLDEHPAASIWLTKVWLWWRDNNLFRATR